MGIEPHGGGFAPPRRCARMLQHVCVACSDDEPAGWALELGAELARRTGARLTLTHVAPLADEAVDARAELHAELSGVREDIRWRKRLAGLAAAVAHDLDIAIRVPTGTVAPHLLALLEVERPDLLLMGAPERHGTDALLGSGLRHRILAGARCPVLLVPAPPAAGRPLILAEGERPTALARKLASALGWGLVRPEPGRATAQARLLAACREQEPALVVAEGEPLHGIRDRLGLSRLGALIGRAGCSVLVLPRRAAGAADGVAAVAGARPALLRQLFAANAIVLTAALVVLLLAPVSVSREVVLAEALTLGLGLAVILAANLLLLRRTLEPLRRLAATMGATDAVDAGRRFAPGDAGVEEVRTLADSFNAMLDRLEDHRRRSARLALAAQEDERKRIAREMHDQVGQTLTALTLQAHRVAECGDGGGELLGELTETAGEALDEVRRIGRELRPEALDDLGLGSALIALCRRLGAQSGTAIVPSIEPQIPALETEVELVVYRVAQESLSNALRHAAASRVELGLRVAGGSIELSVSDDGRGLPASLPEDTAGIAGMRERAALVGGTLGLRSLPQRGTEVLLSIPFSD